MPLITVDKQYTGEEKKIDEIDYTGGAVSGGYIVGGTVGQYVIFKETVSVYIDLVTWKYNNSLVGEFYNGTSECYNRYIGRCRVSRDGTLRLYNLTFDDEDIYHMAAKSEEDANITEESTYELRVYPALNAPVLDVNSTSHRFVSGTYVRLHCNTSSQNVTDYSFKRGGKDICKERYVTCRDSYLYFQPMKAVHNGSYTCAIGNPTTYNTSNTLQLTATEPVSSVKLTSDKSGLLWPGRDDVALYCAAEGTNLSYSWSLQGAPLPQDPRYVLRKNNSTLRISPVNKNDNGAFTCTASNWINHKTSKQLVLNLASEVSAVTLTSNNSGLLWDGEDSVSLNCSAVGSGTDFLWKLNGKTIRQDSRYRITQKGSPPSSNLTISPVRKSDSGSFSCTVSNKINITMSKELTLRLAWRPEGEIRCSVERDRHGVELDCSWPGGEPAAYVTQHFNGVIVAGRDKVSTSFPQYILQGKELICRGEQLGRTSECIVQFEPPQAPGHDNSSLIKADIGSTVVLTVNLIPALPAEFTWYRLTPKPVPVPDNIRLIVESSSFMSRLRIRDIRPEDAEKYECRAKNIIGTQYFLFEIDSPVESNPSGGLSGGALAGIVIGVIFGLNIIIFTTVYIILRRRKTACDPTKQTCIQCIHACPRQIILS
ncbi:carcinoembryonic antigen-related cell adhesion molecule 1-like [Hyperolius riggenbachi]|uniref:carcinoembryonic antigen-related cell adhesion molecule 1-like n=1 Tax=Hyperolius riggenbachi TaxID=752182 RepID=UPI0035A2F656